MKKSVATLLISGILLLGVKAIGAEMVDYPQYSSNTPAPQPIKAEKFEKPKRKKFFSILERNKNSDKNELNIEKQNQSKESEEIKDTQKIDAESKQDTQETKQPSQPEFDNSYFEKNGMVEFKSRTKRSDEPVVNEGETTNVLVDSDTIEYFPERHEFEALGNAKVTFTSENSTLTADKIIFNHDTNYIKAYDNVVLMKEGQKVFGDYMQVNLNDENALISKPVMSHMNIRITAKVANVNRAKTEALEGNAKFTDSQVFHMVNRSIFGFENPPMDTEDDKFYLLKEKYNNEWKIKSKVIIVDSYKDRDIVTIKDADVYLKDLKVARTGKIKVYTDKEQNYVETNLLEFGSIRNMGMYLSPGYVVPLPFASTLKIGPALGYKSGIGFGGLARFQNAYNRTDFGYTTATTRPVMRGEHHFNDKLWLQYGINAYMNEWWMGGRMPEFGTQLVYSEPFENEDLKLKFENRFAGGIYRDWGDGFTTARFRWMTSTDKGIYEYKNSDKKFALNFGVQVQSNASVYGTGDTYGLIRTGPYLKTQYRGWQQYAAYHIGGEAGQSPFWFDKFFYSKSSVMLGEALRINKYLTLMYSAIIALADTPDNRMLQENRFYIVVGPDDFKVLLGYDAYRQTTTFGFNMAVGSDNSELDFQRLILNDIDNLGKVDTKRKAKLKKDEPNKDEKKSDTSNNADKSVREYEEFTPAYNMLNNMLNPAGIRPPNY